MDVYEERKKPIKGFVKKHGSTGKAIVIAVLCIGFMIPLGMITGAISKRSYQQSAAVESIEKSWAGSQSISGPILAVPYEVMENYRYFDDNIGKNVTEKRRVLHYQYTLPEDLTVKTDLETDIRNRGIYSVPVYTASLKGASHFRPEELPSGHLPVSGEAKPVLFFSIYDIRGIEGDVVVKIGDNKASILPGTGVPAISGGFHAQLNNMFQAGEFSGEDFSVEFSFAVRGTKSIFFAPTGKKTSVKMASSWPHPSFTGNYLPGSREISDEGFSASWDIGFLATSMEEKIRDCSSGNGSCKNLYGETFGVSLFQPVDIYKKAKRAVEYGFLFISLTFALFFIFEVMKKMPVHPIQYILVGCSLAMFFLLLVSLSEHISFPLAYGISASAVVALLGYYVSYILREIKWGALFAVLVASLYAYLYAVLSSEDNALLMGSIFLFGMLSLIMFLTRKIDWYGHGSK